MKTLFLTIFGLCSLDSISVFDCRLSSELQRNKLNTSDTDAAFLDLRRFLFPFGILGQVWCLIVSIPDLCPLSFFALSISYDIVSTKIYDKRVDFDFEIVMFPFLDGDVPRSTSYGVYISQLIRFNRASSYVADFSARNKLLTQKLPK